MALASPSDLIVDGYSTDQVTAALSWATSTIEGYCNRTFDLVTGDVVTITPRARGGLLPHYPVVQVTLVEGYLPTDEGMAWVPLIHYWVVAETGELFDTTHAVPRTNFALAHSWPWWPGSLRVTYDHGYAVIPVDLRDVCVRLAGQYLENPRLMIERRVGDMEARFSGSAGVLFGQMDKSILDRYCDTGVA